MYKYLSIKKIKISDFNFFLAVLLAFAIPFSLHILPFIIGLWTLTFLISGTFVENMRMRLGKRRNLVLFILLELFFLLHVIGMAYTNNHEIGWFDVQVKISLALIPLLVIGADKIFEKNFKFILLSFVLGLIVASIACYINAIIHSIHFEKGNFGFDTHPFPGSTDSYFRYQLFSRFVLPTYFSTFLLFGIAILLYFLNQKITFNGLSRLMTILIIVFFSVTIFLLSSRAGLITWLLIFTVFLLYLRFSKKLFSQWFALAYPIILVVALFIFVTLNGTRFKPVVHEIQDTEQMNQNTVLGSVGLRIVIWKAAVKAIGGHGITGVGTGDVRETLYAYSDIPGLDQAQIKNLNVHNQFLETFVALGIPGILCLMALFILPVADSHNNNQLLLILFLVIVAFNFIFESMFDRLSGVVFFVFFYSLTTFLIPGEKVSDARKSEVLSGI